MSENPSPLPFLEKKKTLLGDDYTPHPHLKPLYSKSFLQSTSTSLLIINPLHSRVAHRSFDLSSGALKINPSKISEPCQYRNIFSHSTSRRHNAAAISSQNRMKYSCKTVWIKLFCLFFLIFKLLQRLPRSTSSCNVGSINATSGKIVQLA